MAKKSNDFDEEYGSRLKTIKIIDKTNKEIVNLPVCYAKATTHIRKPIPITNSKDIEDMMYKTIECSTCPVFVSCIELTKVDLMFSQVLILRDILNKMKNG